MLWLWAHLWSIPWWSDGQYREILHMIIWGSAWTDRPSETSCKQDLQIFPEATQDLGKLSCIQRSLSYLRNLQARSLQRFHLAKILEKIFYPIILLADLVLCIGRRIHWGNCFACWASYREIVRVNAFKLHFLHFALFLDYFFVLCEVRTNLPNSIDDWQRTTVKRAGGHRTNCRLERSPDILQHNLHNLNFKMKSIEKIFKFSFSVKHQ